MMHNDISWLLYPLLAVHYWPITLGIIAAIAGAVWYVRRK